MNFVLNNLKKINTKRLLSYYRKQRAILSGLHCACCGEILDRDLGRAQELQDILKKLKEELATREHIPQKSA